MNIQDLKKKLSASIEDGKLKKTFKTLKKKLNIESDIYKEFTILRKEFNIIQDAKMAGIDGVYDTREKLIQVDFQKFIQKLEATDLIKANETTHEEVTNKILILTTKPEIEKVKTFFSLLNISNVEVKPVTTVFDTATLDTFDLIVFDNQDLQPCPRKDFLEKMDSEDKIRVMDRIDKMDKIVKETTRFIIHYGNFLYWINSNRERVQAANSKFSLYARTKEVIEFINTYRV